MTFNFNPLQLQSFALSILIYTLALCRTTFISQRLHEHLLYPGIGSASHRKDGTAPGGTKYGEMKWAALCKHPVSPLRGRKVPTLSPTCQNISSHLVLSSQKFRNSLLFRESRLRPLNASNQQKKKATLPSNWHRVGRACTQGPQRGAAHMSIPAHADPQTHHPRRSWILLPTIQCSHLSLWDRKARINLFWPPQKGDRKQWKEGMGNDWEVNREKDGKLGILLAGSRPAPETYREWCRRVPKPDIYLFPGRLLLLPLLARTSSCMPVQHTNTLGPFLCLCQQGPSWNVSKENWNHWWQSNHYDGRGGSKGVISMTFILPQSLNHS